MESCNKLFTLISFGCLLTLCSCEKEPVIPDDCLVKGTSFFSKIIPDEYIITYNFENNFRSLQSLEYKVEESLERMNISSSAIEQILPGENTIVVAALQSDELDQLKRDPNVESIEPDRIIGIKSCITIVTPRSVSWSVRKTGYGRIGLVSNKVAWIIDTGLDLDHPDLNIDSEKSRSFITGQTSADDNNGHGTHVAGIIGAKNNLTGILGIASDIKLVGLKVLNDLGEGRLSNVISAVRHVTTNGKSGDVVNMSLGGEGISLALEREIQQAADKGILFSIAAGNDKKNVSGYSPARFNHPNVFTVAAVDSFNRFATFSNFGEAVDVAAYGVNIVSTFTNGRYATMSGTSMAAPHLSGLLLTRGVNIPTRGFASNSPDAKIYPVARE